MILLSLNNVSYKPLSTGTFLKNRKTNAILTNITFDITAGSITAITGESGAGKSTLAKIISGIISPSSGKIKFHSDAFSFNNIQILFQNNEDLLNPFRLVKNVLAEAFELNDKSGDTKSKVDSILEKLGLPNSIKEKKGYQLSGGERQRIAIARLLAVRPKLLVLDEPFSALDIEAQKNLLDLLLSLKNEFDLTIVCISHNLRVLKKLADNVIVMKDGGIVEQGTANEVFNSPQHSYTNYLLKAENFDLTMEELIYE